MIETVRLTKPKPKETLRKGSKNKKNSITLQERGAWEKGPHNTIVGAESKWASINGKTKQAVRKGENLT